MRRQHLVDVTEIYSQLTWEKQLRLYKLFYLIILLILCIFWYCGSRCFDTLHESLFGLYEVTFKYVIGYFGLLEEIIIDQASVLPTSLPTVSIFRLLIYFGGILSTIKKIYCFRSFSKFSCLLACRNPSIHRID